jgi:hypothetical protein
MRSKPFGFRNLEVVVAYWLQAGCAWQLLPHDLPPGRSSRDLACRHHRHRADRRRPRPPRLAEVRQVGQPSDQRITLA